MTVDRAPDRICEDANTSLQEEIAGVVNNLG